MFLLGGLYELTSFWPLSAKREQNFQTNSCSVCLASILRLIAVVNQPNNADMTWNLNNQAIWATTEADFAIISGRPRDTSFPLAARAHDLQLVFQL